MSAKSVLFLGLGSLFVGLSVGSGLGRDSLEQVEGSVLGSDGHDELLLVEILDEGSGDGSSNLELLADDGSGDAQDLWQLFEHSLVLFVVKEHGVVKLLLNLDFGP